MSNVRTAPLEPVHVLAVAIAVVAVLAVILATCAVYAIGRAVDNVQACRDSTAPTSAECSPVP